ncbi:MAG: RICIN domain-containing protein [Bacteroidales bacterium]|nr:RICIN domain-containing protein [Bacteroidales bacterium]
MKKLSLLIIILSFGLLAQAQSISVKTFRALPTDMTASSLEGKRIDQNGDVAALIKVVTTQTGFTFEGGTLGIVDTKQRNGEIWVWVPRASRKITILHQQLGVLRDYRFPVDIESERTYEMVLTTAKVETVIKEEVHQQYLVFQVSPANATLEVNDKLWSVDADGTALQFVDFGTYTYRVRAANYISDAGVVTVDDPDNPQNVKVTLKPDFAEVTLKVDADAEIWVNNEKKGVRTWTGPLGKGTYKIECKQESHETSMISKEITTEMNGQIITLPAPTPIYGSLNVESTPIGATIYIDGKEVGKTPRSFNEILVGEHEIRLTKEGYSEHKETVIVAKGERKQVKAPLNEIVVQTEIKSDGVSNTHNSVQQITEGEYVIRLAQNPNYVLTLKDGKVKSGTIVHLWQWQNDNSQKWKVTYKDGKLVIRNVANNNLVFDIYGNNIRNSSQIQVYDYHGGNNQLWIPERQSNGTYVLMSAANKAFGLDNYGGFVNNGNKIQLWNTNKGLAQQWILEKVSNTSDQQITEGVYVIKLAHNPNYVLTLKDGTVKSGTIVHLWQWQNDNSQKWKVTYKDGKLVIRSVANNNLAFDIYGNNIRNSSQIQVFDYHGGNNQLWIPEKQSSGAYVLMTAANKAFSLDNYGGHVNNGNKIQLWNTNKGYAQQWVFEKLSD